MSVDKGNVRAAAPVSRRSVLYGSVALAALSSLKSAYAAPTGSTVLVTGTSSGFGRLMAEGFARRGYRVAATMRETRSRNAAAAAELRAIAEASKLDLEVIEIDILDQTSVDSGVAQAMDRFGRIDVLVNNAGIVVPGPIEILPQAAFQRCMDTNMGGAMRMTRAVAPHMRNAGRGTIIYISSTLAHAAAPMLSSYCASKSAGEIATETLSYELAHSNIEVAIVQVANAYATNLQKRGVRDLNDLLSSLGEKGSQLRDIYKAHSEAILRDFERLASANLWEVPNAVIAMTELPFGSRPGRLIVGSDAPDLKAVNSANSLLGSRMTSHSSIADLIKPI